MKKIYWLIGIIMVIFIFTNPANPDFKQYLTLNHYIDDNHDNIDKNFGREYYLLFFSLYRFEFKKDSLWSEDVPIFKMKKHRDSVPPIRIDEGSVERTYEDLQSDGISLPKSPSEYIEDMKKGGDKFIKDIQTSKAPKYYKMYRVEGFYWDFIKINKDSIIQQYHLKKISFAHIEYLGIMKNFVTLKTFIDHSYLDTVDVELGIKAKDGIEIIDPRDTGSRYYIY